MTSPARRRFSAHRDEFESLVDHIESVCASLEHDDRLRLVLIVEELFANSVNHGYGGDSDKPVWLTIEVDDAQCRLVYEDCAPEFDPFASVDMTTTEADIESRRVGGLGVVLLVELSSRRSYHRDGDRNVIDIDIPHAPRH